jgi:hypothetical protein
MDNNNKKKQYPHRLMPTTAIGIFSNLMSLEEEISIYLSLYGFKLGRGTIDTITEKLKDKFADEGQGCIFPFLYEIVEYERQRQTARNSKKKNKE